VTGYGDGPGIQPSVIGNDALKPEKSQELEIGFDAGFFNDRIDLNFTHYDRVVTDAMANRSLPPSLGFTGNQTVNLGRLEAWGNEVGLNARVVERSSFAYEVGLSYATMHNKIADLGTLDTGLGSNRLGYSIGDLYAARVTSATFVNGENGPVTNIMCDGGTGPLSVDQGGTPELCGAAPHEVRWGHTQPTWQLSFNQTVSLGQYLRLAVTVDGTGGHRQSDSTGPARHTSYCTTRQCRIPDDPIVQAYRAIGRGPLGFYEAGFAKLREVSLAFTLPQGMANKIGGRTGSLTFSGRNLAMLWTKANGFNTPRSGWVPVLVGESITWDPETRSTGDLSSGYQTTMPPLTSGVVTFRLGF
jgi:TonB-dependent starch-binding outer membrane protein SusC